jgi:hypothetical protein
VQFAVNITYMPFEDSLQIKISIPHNEQKNKDGGLANL